MSDTRFCDNGCGYKLPSEYLVDETTCGACLDAHDMITTQIASATADTNTTHKGDTRMTNKKQSASPATPLNYVLLDVRLTVAVESYWCEEHEGEATDFAIEQVMESFENHNGVGIIVLGSDISRLRVQS